MPPSTGITVPVMSAPAAKARKATRWGDILGLAEIADRDVSVDEGAAGFLGGMELLEDLLAVDAAGLDGVDRHALGRDLAGQALGPQVQGRLGRHRGLRPRGSMVPLIDNDAAPAALAHAGRASCGQDGAPR